MNFDAIEINKTKNVCLTCKDSSMLELNKRNLIAILSCEGACLRDEIIRRVASKICYKIAYNRTSRICLRGASTTDAGQRNIVKKANRVIILEGCFFECASIMMKGVISIINQEVLLTKLFKY